MLHNKQHIREAVCSGIWYPPYKQKHYPQHNPDSTAVISPHAGFFYTGKTSLKAVSQVKTKRVWIFGTSHYEKLAEGISIYPGIYHSSAGKTRLPELSSENLLKLKKYFSQEGHRADEHSIENVLYCLNHYDKDANVFCTLVRINNEKDFDKIGKDISEVWESGDSVIISTDWNHFVATEIIDKLMSEISELLENGKIETLYEMCKKGIYEACGIDGVYLAYKIFANLNLKTAYKIIDVTDSSKSKESDDASIKNVCVGYLAATSE